MLHPSIELLSHKRLVAIIRLDDLSHAVELSQALLRGGIVAQEYTLTNPHALSAIRQIISAVPQFSSGEATIGVGSVRSAEQAIEAAQAGAQFIVSPNTDTEVISACHSVSIPCMPGAMTPTEIAYAWKLGAAAVKVFPIRTLGPSYITDVLGPLPDVRLMPTGGIDLSNMHSYLNSGAFAVGIGVNALNKDAIKNCQWDLVTDIAAQCAKVANGG